MPNVKRALGRGLAELLPVGGAGGDSEPDLGPGQEVPIGSLHPNPRQPRKFFEPAALEELAESVRENGILQPLLVRPRPTGGYEIVAGERRFKAALKAGLKKVPVVVRQLSDEDTLALALIENLVRADLSPMETARAFQRLMEDYGWTQEEMGKRVGKSRSAVANSLRLLRLPEEIQQGLEQGQISEGHARALIGDDEERNSEAFRQIRQELFSQVVEQGLSVRELERLLRQAREGTTDTAEATPATPATPTTPTTPTTPATSTVGETHGAAVSDLPEPAGNPGTAFAPPPVPALPVESRAPGQPGPKLGEKLGETLSPEAIQLEAISDRLREALGTRVRVAGSLERGRIEIEFYSSEELDGLLERLT